MLVKITMRLQRKTSSRRLPASCCDSPKRHRQLLPQDTLYHLVEVGIHSVDLSAAALLLGLLLPQLLEQGQVLVKIVGVQQRLIMFCQRCLYPPPG